MSKMKTLLLMRHAKSDWDDQSLVDHERPLNARGEKDAPKMGKHLVELGLIPDLILCSTAVRAKMTAEAVAAETGYDSDKIVFHSELYLPRVDTMLDLTEELPEEKNTVLIVSHNPGISQFLGRLAGNFLNVPEMPTCAVARLELYTGWDQSGPGAFMLKTILTPKKDLK